MGDFHEYEKRIDRYLKNLRAGLGGKDRELVLGFIKDNEARGLSRGRVFKYLWHMKGLLKLLPKNLLELKTEDLKEAVRRIEAKPFKEWTKHDYKMVLRKFALWLAENQKLELDVSWMRLTVKNPKKMPEELLTQEEVQKLVEACDNPRDKALIAVLYESGCRVGEILGLKVKHIQFDQYGAVLLVDGKTGQRRVRIISSSPLLASYLDVHPFREQPDSYLWLTKFSRKGVNKTGWNTMMYKGVSQLLKRLGQTAKISKRLYPHLFRHSRATHLANLLTEAQMKEHFGWVQASEMASVYVHLSGRDVDDALLKMYCIKPANGQEEQKIKPVNCPKCKEPNSSLQNYCRRCGSPLDAMEVMQEDQRKKEFENMLMEFLKVLAEENPAVKEKFRSLAERKGMNGFFR